MAESVSVLYNEFVPILMDAKPLLMTAKSHDTPRSSETFELEPGFLSGIHGAGWHDLNVKSVDLNLTR